MSLLNARDNEDRPWGSFDRFTHGEASTVKIITVSPDHRLSLQYHAKRSEFWRVLSGSGIASINGEDKPAKAGDEFEIGVGVKHRLAAGPEGITVLEIALGDFDENDIVRVEDDYGRTAPAGP